MLQFLLTQIGKIKAAISAINEKTTTSPETNVHVIEDQKIASISFEAFSITGNGDWKEVCSVPQPGYATYFFFVLYDATNGRIIPARIYDGKCSVSVTNGATVDLRGVVTYFK